MPIVYCSVCQSEVLLELGQLSAAACGHTFHSECLNKWLKEGAKTCPVCRKSTKNSLALFLDFAPENETTATNRTSNDVLRCRVESLEFQLRLKEEERKQASDKLAMLEQNKRDLRAEAKKLETLLKNEADRRRSLDSQLVFLTKELSTAVGYRDEAKRLRSQLEGLKNLKTALQGTEEDVEDMMAGYSSKSEEMKSLATFSVMLKKQLVKSQDSKGNILQELSKYQKENGALKSQVKELRSRVEILENDICLLDSEHIKHLKQNEDLKNKLKVLSKSRTSKSVASRSDTKDVRSEKREEPCLETTADFLSLKNDESIFLTPDEKSSKDVADSILEIIEEKEESPKASTSHSRGNDAILSNLSIMRKRPMTNLSNSPVKRNRDSDISFNGFGSSSRPDIFPVPSSTKTSARTVRIKSGSTVKMAKITDFIELE